MPREKMLTVKEVAAWFGVHPMTIYRKAKRGELPAIKFGKSWLFPEDALKGWIAERMPSKNVRQQSSPPGSASLGHLTPLLLVYHFGSTATGHETPLSDVDVAYLDDGSVKPFDFEIDVEAALRPLFPAATRFDLVRLNDAPARMRYKILRTGKLLYARSELERALFEERTIRDFLDYEPMLAKFYHEVA